MIIKVPAFLIITRSISNNFLTVLKCYKVEFSFISRTLNMSLNSYRWMNGVMGQEMTLMDGEVC